VEADFAREAGGRMIAFITEKPVVSACLRRAVGVVLGLLIRRRDGSAHDDPGSPRLTSSTRCRRKRIRDVEEG